MPVAFDDADPVKIRLYAAVKVGVNQSAVNPPHHLAVQIGKQRKGIGKCGIFKTRRHIGYVLLVNFPSSKVLLNAQITLKLKHIRDAFFGVLLDFHGLVTSQLFIVFR